MSELIQAVINCEEKSDLCQVLLKLSRLITTRAIAFTLNRSPKKMYSISLRQKILYESLFRVRNPNRESGSLRLTDDLNAEELTVQELLDVRDRFVNRYHPNEGDILELDFQPFYDYSPAIRDPKNIGKGVQYINRYLSSKLFQDPRQWLESLFDFLRLHQYEGSQLLINGQIQSQQQLSDQIKKALTYVGKLDREEPYEKFRYALQPMGFEPGWGNTAGRVAETLEILDELIDSPDHQTLEAFISRIPMVFKIVLVSAHGWFGQEGVLGRPDTGGQVVYVLDQARSLEKQLQEDTTLAGLDVLNVQPKVIILSRLIPNSDGTLCNQRLEKVHGTENAWILRVPLREFNPKMTQNWISRFEFWPYLETFALDSEKELRSELRGNPDLIIGNYTDGNLVAFLLARRMKVTQCNIAHALEKSKYLFSNLYWQDLEEKYHFSLQFTADLIAMNAANFIISSTYQEIVGTPDSVGQYESYKCFTMPELYHVVSGIELFSPKFNVVPPGVNETYYFPYSRWEDRTESDRNRMEELLFTQEDPSQIFGKLDDPTKRPIFSMARLDRIKNLTGLAECFGKSPELQEHCNLIFSCGKFGSKSPVTTKNVTKLRSFTGSLTNTIYMGIFAGLSYQNALQVQKDGQKNNSLLSYSRSNARSSFSSSFYKYLEQHMHRLITSAPLSLAGLVVLSRVSVTNDGSALHDSPKKESISLLASYTLPYRAKMSRDRLCSGFTTTYAPLNTEDNHFWLDAEDISSSWCRSFLLLFSKLLAWSRTYTTCPPVSGLPNTPLLYLLLEIFVNNGRSWWG
uniref:Sucrose synthase n=1 Tax=Gloeocapsopsis dulcis AAB1 = 1H9 TaxID=1433147 RepID=W8P8V9_9CHRO|nr:sucrose synthase [Gloeocapsopsis dulcis AAB1 = 1H9]